MPLGSRLPAALAALLCTSTLAGVSHAAFPASDKRKPIVVQSSIRGVALGMTPAEVRSKLGAPASTRVDLSPIIGKIRIWRYHGLRISFDSVRAGRTVLSVSSTSRRDRTSAGVGVDSSEADVERFVRGARCMTRYGYRSCIVGSLRPGQTVTDFSVSGAGKVSRVTLSRVVD
jgi:hypothetical protein